MKDEDEIQTMRDRAGDQAMKGSKYPGMRNQLRSIQFALSSQETARSWPTVKVWMTTLF